MKEVKILLIDVDGTLCGRDNKVPSSACDAIKAIKAHGHKVFIVTGRALAEIYDDILAIGFDGIIGGNGSYIKVDNKMLKHEIIDNIMVERLRKWMDEQQIGYYLECNSGLYANKYFKEKFALNIYNGNNQQAEKELAKVFPNLIYENKEVIDVNKISFILDSKVQLEQAKLLFGNDIKVDSWGVFEHDQFGEFSLHNIDKASSVELLLTYLNKTWDDTIAFGDSIVDIDMIKKAKVGVAMGNAKQALKDVADLVCDDVDNDGLAKALEELELI